MNIAILIAGGSGQRMGQEIPKQFLNVYDKPVIVYTLEAFERHPDIDEIDVVLIDGWEPVLWAYARQFGIRKLKKIVPGAACGQASIFNGLAAVREDHADDDIVLIHDAIRPMVSPEIISDAIVSAKKHGSGIAVVPCAEAMLETTDGSQSASSYPRDHLRRTQTPQAFPLSRIWNAHIRAKELGITQSVASCTLLVELGETVHFSIGSEKNIKLTTTDDLEIFKALLNAQKDQWLK